MSYKIPNQGTIRQFNLSDTQGELSASRNVFLNPNTGKLELGRRLDKVYFPDGGQRTVAFAPEYVGASNFVRMYAMTDSTLIRANSPFTSWTTVVDAGNNPVLSTSSTLDMVWFQGQLVWNNTDDLNAFNKDTGTLTTDWWTARGNPSLQASYPSRVLEVSRIGTEKLLVTDKTFIHSYEGGITGSPVLSSSIPVEEELFISCVSSGIRSIWIGTISVLGEDAYVYEWDGSSTDAFTQSYPTGSSSVLSILTVENTPYILTGDGEIKVYNGVAFVNFAQFPFAFDNDNATLTRSNDQQARPVHPKGMKYHKGKIYIYVNYNNGDNELIDGNETHAGVWVLDLQTRSLMHYGSPDNHSVLNQDVITSLPLSTISSDAGEIMVASRLLNDSNNFTNPGIWLAKNNDTIQYGYIVTPEIEIDSIKSSFTEVVVKASMGQDEKIMVKYKTEREVNYPLQSNGTWLSSTVYNSTDDLSLIKERFDNGYQDEIEILTGNQSARLAHITDVSFSGGTYSITVDEAISSNGNDTLVVFDNWKKVPIEMTKEDGEVKRFGVDGVSSWFQAKIAMQGVAGRLRLREVSVLANNKEKK